MIRNFCEDDANSLLLKIDHCSYNGIKFRYSYEYYVEQLRSFIELNQTSKSPSFISKTLLDKCMWLSREYIFYLCFFCFIHSFSCTKVFFIIFNDLIAAKSMIHMIVIVYVETFWAINRNSLRTRISKRKC